MKQMRRLRDIGDLALSGSDGEVGSIQDLLFDRHSWVVRYFVVKTGGWLCGRTVLIAPVAVGGIDDEERMMRIKLTKGQIEQAPPVDHVKPLLREFEVAYYQHFNWAPYWQPGPAAWESPVPFPYTPPPGLTTSPLPDPAESQPLSSSSDMTGYGIHAQDGEIGHVEDLVIDDEDWIVRYVEVDTRNWLPGKKVLIQTNRIERMDLTQQSVTVALSRRTIESAPAYDPSQLITPAYEIDLFK